MNVAWIGTGVMGTSCVRHLLEAGHNVTVHTRSRPRALSLLESGARWADDPAEAASGADVICSMVGWPADVEAVHLGPRGSLRSAPRGAILIDLTTSRPSLAREIARQAEEKGVASLDAPVSGGDVGARQATLSIMVGGRTDVLEAVRPLLDRLGRTIVHHGGPGSGQHAKMVNQILIAGIMMGLCEGLAYGRRTGLDLSAVLTSVGGGAAGSWAVQNLAPRILKGDFAPGFFVEHFIKDLTIALEEATAIGLDLPALSLARELYARLQAHGHGRSGTQALIHEYGDDGQRGEEERPGERARCAPERKHAP